MIDSEVRELADAVLGPLLGPYGFVGADVRSGPDHLNEPAFFVTARLEPSRRLTGRVTTEATGALHDALQDRGEHRFPYLSFDFLGQEAPFEPVVESSG